MKKLEWQEHLKLLARLRLNNVYGKLADIYSESLSDFKEENEIFWIEKKIAAFEIQNCSLDELIEQITKLSVGYENIRLEFYSTSKWEDNGDIDIEIALYGWRKETEAEEKKRIAIVNKLDLDIKTQKQAKEQTDLELYKKLHKKYKGKVPE